MIGVVKVAIFVVFILPPAVLALLHSAYYYVGARKGDCRRLRVPNPVGGLSVTVLIPIKNEPEELVAEAVRAIARVKDELGDRYEVVILSDDPSERARVLRDVAESTAREVGVNLRFVVRTEGNPGRSNALNYIVPKLASDVIIILDVDARPSRGYISKLLKCLEEGYAACVGRWSGYWRVPTKLAIAVAKSMKFIVDAIYRGRSRAGLFTFPLGSGTAFRREALIDVGLWDEGVIQDDMHIGAKLMGKGFKVGYIDDVDLKVLVPSTYSAFRTQQSRWAFGAAETLRRSLKYIARSPYPFLHKVESALFLAQYVPSAVICLATLAIPILALLLNDDILNLPPALIASVITAFAIYSVASYLSLRSEGIRFKRALRIMGASSALTLALSPSILIHTLLGFIKFRGRYRVTPKASHELKSRGRPLIELLFIAYISLMIVANLLQGPHVFTVLWLGTVLSAFIYVVTNAEKVVSVRFGLNRHS